MTKPFEDSDGRYVVLVNDGGQYSLWPAFADTPSGWTEAHREDTRQACLEFVERNWASILPRTLGTQPV
ncbi:MbtH family protein [Streptomyces sp. NPDC051217]|uniref:MbtH family protein n=1 Tax=Streptomyces sp. NPDC051217 TaxID=3365644 RepID=UPI00379A1674